MTIGTLTLWNFGNRVRSRQFHYPLHMISATEKDAVCESLWKQHAEEMTLIESNVVTIKGEKVTFEFQPSADQALQCWAANCLPSSATYPSPYANVHKSDLKKVDASIGIDKSSTWQVPTMSQRKEEVRMLETFRKSLKKDISPQVAHKKELAFMATNGFCQLGEPRIGIFADRIRPEPLHLEINNWQHVLDLLYKEAVRRGRFKEFIEVLGNPAHDAENLGCGLRFVAMKIEEHYSVESVRFKKLDIRLIGAQAISLAQYSFRLIDILITENESSTQMLKRLALAKMCENLRDIGSQINRVAVPNESYAEQIKILCRTYFNIFSLFFPESCQSTVWTLGYALPYHAEQIYTQYKVGYGIISMQGKEAKHSALKQELKCGTNRSNVEDTGKWNQIMRSSYVRNFYLPYHFPVSTSYHSHYRPRKAPHQEGENCMCSRNLLPERELCQSCIEAVPLMQSVQNGMVSSEILKILKPIECRECHERFTDFVASDRHIVNVHRKNGNVIEAKKVVPAKMNVTQLKAALKERGKSTSGNKDELCRRLEGELCKEI